MSQLPDDESTRWGGFLFSDLSSHVDDNIYSVVNDIVSPNLRSDPKLDSPDYMLTPPFLSPIGDDNLIAGTKCSEGEGTDTDKAPCDELDSNFISDPTSISTFASSPTEATTIGSAPSQPFLRSSYLPEIPSHDTETLMRGGTGSQLEAELDQLYFDRVHALIPLIHRTSYFSWSRQPNKSDVRSVLQSAMRALAAAASASLQQLGESLYMETRQRLVKLHDAHEQDWTGNAPLEQIQAWLLLAHYEFMCKPYRRAIMTAGHAFRLVQIALLHQVDAYDPGVALDGSEATPDNCGVEAEQKRRTFWVAYCLDRCAGLHCACPLTFHEDAIRTRLPAPEVDFENSRPVCTEFLSGNITASDQRMSSSFTACIIFLTLWGRCMAHRQGIQTDDTLELCAQYECLNDIVDTRRTQLQQYSSTVGVLADPMLVFACLIATLSSSASPTLCYRVRLSQLRNINY